MSEKTTRRGDSGEAVKRIQRILARQMTLITVDGVFGPATEREVKSLQASNGLADTGIVDAATWTLLYDSDPRDGAPSPVLKRGSSGRWVHALQDRLLEGAGDIGDVARMDGAVDGSFGPKTEAAVIRLQKDLGLVGDGIVGDRTWFQDLPYPGVLHHTLEYLIYQEISQHV